MEFPQFYQTELRRNTQNQRLVQKLHKSIFGLKQAARQWTSKLSSSLIKAGFTQSKNNYSLFVKGKDDNFLTVLVYVDNIILAEPNKNLINNMKQSLHVEFQLKDLGALKYFLGLEIDYNDKGITLTQRLYVLKLLEDVDFLGCRPHRVPMDPNFQPSKSDGKSLTDQSQYKRIIWQLLYLTVTHPDITYVVHKLSQFVSNPFIVHLAATQTILRCIKGSSGVKNSLKSFL